MGNPRQVRGKKLVSVRQVPLRADAVNDSVYKYLIYIYISQNAEQVRGKKLVSVRQVPLRADAVNDSDVFVLAAPSRIIQRVPQNSPHQVCA